MSISPPVSTQTSDLSVLSATRRAPSCSVFVMACPVVCCDVKDEEDDLPVRHATTSASPEAVYAEIAALGGDEGWYRGKVLWQIRGLLDKLVGGPGLRKGRKRTVGVGETIDFWRIQELRPARRMRLRARWVTPGFTW
jgi:Protein of unknown function (DUF2867)